MKKILGIIILLLAVGVTGCLDTNKEEKTHMGEDQSKEKEKTEIIKKEPKKKLIEEVDTDLQFSLEEVEGGSATFVYKVHNTGETSETLEFTSGQRFEYEVYRGNELVTKYSDGMSFTQALADIRIEPDEKLPFEISIPDIKEQGEYTINIYLVAKRFATTSKVSKNFIIEASIK